MMKALHRKVVRATRRARVFLMRKVSGTGRNRNPGRCIVAKYRASRLVSTTDAYSYSRSQLWNLPNPPPPALASHTRMSTAWTIGEGGAVNFPCNPGNPIGLSVLDTQVRVPQFWVFRALVDVGVTSQVRERPIQLRFFPTDPWEGILAVVDIPIAFSPRITLTDTSLVLLPHRFRTLDPGVWRICPLQRS
jgi:hypothetical protein